ILPTALRIVLLPVPAVDPAHARDLESSLVQAAHVDAVAVRVRARHVEGLDAAVRAEEVPRDFRVELVVGQRILAGEQPEILFLDEQVLVPRACAHRAVAIAHLECLRRLDLEAHAPAMATAGMRRHPESFSAISASRRPCATQSALSASEIGRSSARPAKWLAPYGVPPLRVAFRSARE